MKYLIENIIKEHFNKSDRKPDRDEILVENYLPMKLYENYLIELYHVVNI